MDINSVAWILLEYWFVVIFLSLSVLFLHWIWKRVFKLFDLWIARQGKKTPDQIQELNEEDAKIDREINNILFDILQKFQPDRVMVLQYHNGSYYNSWQHMKYISCTHEQPNIWVQPWAMQFQKVPSAIFQPVNNPLIEWENQVIFRKVEREVEWEEERRKYVRQVYKNLWFKSYYALALRTHEWYLIWKVTLVWIHKEIDYTEDELDKINWYVWKVESLLNFNRLT